MSPWESRRRLSWPRLSFEVKLALLVLGLSALYALTFSTMLYLSFVEEVIRPAAVQPRYAGPPHHHNAIEWVLIVGPAVAGWAGVAGSATYLVRKGVRSLTGFGRQP